MFFKWSNLGSNVHVTDAKVDDAYGICNQIKTAFDTKIASISVDNAAGKVAESVSKKLQADGDPALPLRDPAHCIDLLSTCSESGTPSRPKSTDTRQGLP
jgi:hypothetical protein